MLTAWGKNYTYVTPDHCNTPSITSITRYLYTSLNGGGVQLHCKISPLGKGIILIVINIFQFFNHPVRWKGCPSKGKKKFTTFYSTIYELCRYLQPSSPDHIYQRSLVQESKFTVFGCYRTHEYIYYANRCANWSWGLRLISWYVVDMYMIKIRSAMRELLVG